MLSLQLAFAALSLAVASGLTQSIDERALLDLHARSGERLTQAIRMLSDIGSGDLIGPVAGVIAGLLLLLGRLRPAVVVVVATAGAAFDPLLKNAFDRPRPRLWPPLEIVHASSYPSGHAMTSMAFAAALTLLAWRTRWRCPLAAAGGIFVGLVGLSRAYLGVH